MDIIGAVLFMLLPYPAGYSCKRILRWRETNQIETYLIGFFFLFFLQGVVLIPCVWLGVSLMAASMVLLAVTAIILLLAGAFMIADVVKAGKKEPGERKTKTGWRKSEQVLFFMSVLIFLLVVLRMILGINILRDDITLETVLTTLQSDALFQNHPLTGRRMETGMIASKKIVTLPLFYACIVLLTGMKADLFLYPVMGIIVLLCSGYAGMLLLSKLTNSTRGKRCVFLSVYGLMLLAGDYYADTLAYRLLYRGYDGTTICFGVILPYLLYLIVSWYKQETLEEAVSMGSRAMYVLKALLTLAVSVVITGLGTGFLFLFMAMVIAGICCLLKSIKEVRECRE